MPERIHPIVVFNADNRGGFCKYEFFACGPWTQVMPPPVGVPLQVDNGTPVPEVMLYDGKKFRSPNGADKGLTVRRYAVVQMVEQVTESLPKPAVAISDGDVMRRLVKVLMDNWKFRDIQDEMDRLRAIPAEGAPL